MNEQEMERVARELGKRAAARIDVERTAAAVMARLRSPEVVRPAPWWGRPGLLRLAAAVTITVGAGLLGYKAMVQSPGNGNGAELASVPIVALQSLSQDELAEVLVALVEQAPAHEDVAVGLDDLNDEELSELLRRMEG